MTEARALQVNDEESKERCENFLFSLKGLLAQVTSHYEYILLIKRALRPKELEKKLILDALNEADESLRSKLVAYLEDEHRKSEAAAKAAQKLLETAEAAERKQVIKDLIAEGKVDEALELKQAPSKVTVFHGEIPQVNDSISVRELLTYEIENVNKIPDKYFSRQLNENKLRQDIQAGKRDIPGVRIFYKKGLAVRNGN